LLGVFLPKPEQFCFLMWKISVFRLVQVVTTTLEECFAEGKGVAHISDLFSAVGERAGDGLESAQALHHVGPVLCWLGKSRQ
jgi:hypothetical protein